MNAIDWDRLVSITVADEWLPIRDSEAAWTFLQERWPRVRGPSYRRAVATCEASLAGEAAPVAARAAFVVAAMEAGLQFSLHRDEIDFLEQKIASVARDSAREAQDTLADVVEIGGAPGQTLILHLAQIRDAFFDGLLP